MWKLLSKRDKSAVNESTQTSSTRQLVVLTTQGYGTYSCASCENYGVAGKGPDPEKSCSQDGVPPDAMPCSWSAKKPGEWFRPRDQDVAPIMERISSLSLEQLLMMQTKLPERIDLLVEQHKLALPYGPGDKVGLVHNQTLVDGIVVSFDAVSVSVTVGDLTLELPHTAVIPKRNPPHAQVFPKG